MITHGVPGTSQFQFNFGADTSGSMMGMGSTYYHSYRVRIINPKNKHDYMELTWHNMSEKFESFKDMKLKLIDSFPDYVPSTPRFQVGYFEGRGNQKRWAVQLEDLKQLYQSFKEGDSIKL